MWRTEIIVLLCDSELRARGTSCSKLVSKTLTPQLFNSFAKAKVICKDHSAWTILRLAFWLEIVLHLAIVDRRIRRRIFLFYSKSLKFDKASFSFSARSLTMKARAFLLAKERFPTF